MASKNSSKSLISSSSLRLLIVDDDPTLADSLRLLLNSASSPWSIDITADPEIKIDKIYHAAFVDMHLTGQLHRAEGLNALKSLANQDPALELVAISGNLDRQLMESCLKAGATRFLAKPLNPDEVLSVLSKIEALQLLKEASHRHNDKQYHWIGQGPASQNIRRQIAFLRGEKGPILIEGETGTGKEVAAHLIHMQDASRPFVALNVSALPENIFESELFGHLKGAFTGADKNKMGLAEAAHGGDLFLDEIEALSLSLQPKLLRFLESGEVRRVGSNEVIKVDVRVLAATNKSLENMVKNNEFREDLLWRLKSKKITLPPLRDRKEDIIELANWFLVAQKSRRLELSPEAEACLVDYSWPGNVRELKRVCEQLTLITPLPIVRAEDVMRLLQVEAHQDYNRVIDLEKGLDFLLTDYEKEIITVALQKLNDIDEVARRLKVSRSNLYKKIKDLKIEWKPL